MVNKASILSAVWVMALTFMLFASISANASDKEEIMNIITDIEYGWENGKSFHVWHKRENSKAYAGL